MEKTKLIRELGRTRFGDALDEAFLHLHEGADLQLLMAMIKAMTRSGLSGLAVRLLKSGGDLLKASPELTKLVAQLDALPTGQLDANVLQDRYERNRVALLSGRPHLEALAGQLDQAVADVSVFEGSQKYVKALRIQGEGRFELAMPLIANAPNFREAIGDLSQHLTSIAMVGVPRMGMWRELMSLRSAAGFQPPFEIIEPDPRVLGVWLCQADMAEALADDRVGVYAGPEAQRDYRQALLEQHSRLIPTHRLINHRTGATLEAIDGEIFSEVERQRNDRKEIMYAIQSERCDDRDEAYWRDRFRDAAEGSRPLKVVGFTTRHSTVIQYAMSGMARAFRKAGCEFDLVMENSVYTSNVEVTATLAGKDYDLIMVINHLRSEMTPNMHECIPHVTWIQDHMEHLWTKNAGNSVGAFDLVLGHDPETMASLYNYPRSRFLETCNLTDPGIFSSQRLPESDLEPYACDVSYVSHGAATPDELIGQMVCEKEQVIADCLRKLASMMNERLETKRCLPGMEIAEMLLQAEMETNCPELEPQVRYRLLYQTAIRLYDRIFRQQALAWTAQWAEDRGRVFRIYGKHWKKHPTLGKYAAGEIENGPDLRALYQASKINLQINGYGSMHQRLLDGLASGGFMLVRFHPADVRRPHYEAIRSCILEQDLNVDSLNALGKIDDQVGAALAAIRELDGVHVGSHADPARMRQVELCKLVFNFSPEQCTDDELLDRMKSLKHMPTRAAGDLDGYEQCVFDSKEKLHSLLDNYVDDAGTREALAEPMRQSVLEHDTHDVLVGRILEHFRAFGVDGRAEAEQCAAVGVGDGV